MTKNHRLPNFLIIGAMKCGTSTLHEQLARQRGIFMSEPKEPNFFSDDEIYEGGISFYESLFARSAVAQLRGESSTHYTKLPTYPRTLERMRSLLPDLKIIYMMRHPIERLVSHYMHEVSLRFIRAPIDRAVEEHSELVDYGCYHMQLSPYLAAYGRGNVLPVFLEHMQRHPQAALEHVCDFLGYEGKPEWVDEVSRENASRERLRMGSIGRTLYENPMLTRLRRALLPQGVRDVVKDRLAMRERPRLSDATSERIALRFDYDLSQLARELDLPHLCCENFKSVVSDAPLFWADDYAPQTFWPRATQTGARVVGVPSTATRA